MNQVTVHRCVLRIRRTAGWAWGASPDALLDAASRALPALVAARLPAIAVSAAQPLHLTAPVRVRVDATLAELAALAGDPSAGTSALAQRVGAAIEAALQPWIGPVIEAAIEAKTAPVVEDDEPAAPEPGVRQAAVRRVLGIWDRSGEIERVLADLAPGAIAALHDAVLVDPEALPPALAAWRHIDRAEHPAASAGVEDLLTSPHDALAAAPESATMDQAAHASAAHAGAHSTLRDAMRRRSLDRLLAGLDARRLAALHAAVLPDPGTSPQRVDASREPLALDLATPAATAIDTLRARLALAAAILRRDATLSAARLRALVDAEVPAPASAAIRAALAKAAELEPLASAASSAVAPHLPAGMTPLAERPETPAAATRRPASATSSATSIDPSTLPSSERPASARSGARPGLDVAGNAPIPTAAQSTTSVARTVALQPEPAVLLHSKPAVPRHSRPAAPHPELAMPPLPEPAVPLQSEPAVPLHPELARPPLPQPAVPLHSKPAVPLHPELARPPLPEPAVALPPAPAAPLHPDAAVALPPELAVAPSGELTGGSVIGAGMPRIAARARGPAIPRTGTEIEIRSVLPFLILPALHHAGWLDTAAILLETYDLTAAGFGLAAALAGKLLDPPERGWMRSRDDRAIIAAFAGTDEPITDDQATAAAGRLAPLLGVLDASLRAVIFEARRPGAPVVLWRSACGWSALDTDGLAVVASAPALATVLTAVGSLRGAPLLIPAACADPATLDRVDLANLRFVTDARPGRGEPWRAFAGFDRPLWTNDTATPTAKLAAVVAPFESVMALAAELTGELDARPAIARTPLPALEATATLAVTAALADLSARLFPTEPGTPILALTRFRDLDARVRFEPDTVRVRVPLGRRHADLMCHRLLGPIAHVPWLGGRSVDLGGA